MKVLAVFVSIAVCVCVCVCVCVRVGVAVCQHLWVCLLSFAQDKSRLVQMEINCGFSLLMFVFGKFFIQPMF